MIPNQKLSEEQKNEFNQALENFKTSEGSNLSYLDLLNKNPSLEDHFRKLIENKICYFEYSLIDLLLSKDQGIPKINGNSTLRSVIDLYGGSIGHDIIKKLITKSDSIENDKDIENNNLIASLLKGDDNQQDVFSKYINEIIDALVEKGIKVDDENNSGQTSLDLCCNLKILKTLAKHASPETLEKKLCHIFESEEDEVDMDVLKFLLTEKKVKIWKLKNPDAKNNFIELVCQDDKIKESFLEQLSSSSSEQRDNFFEGLSEKNLSLILSEIEKRLLIKQEKFKSALHEVENHKTVDPHGVVGVIFNDEVLKTRAARNKLVEDIKNDPDERKKIAFISEFCDPNMPPENPNFRSNSLIGLKPENIQFILDLLNKTVKGFNVLEDVKLELKHLIGQEKEIPLSYDGPIVGSKRPRGDEDKETREIEIRVTSCDTLGKAIPRRASSW
jgi:hypothetical protein